MDGTLQTIVDALADRVGRPVAVEDRRWRLLAFSAHTTPDDQVRQASILGRSAPAEAAAWLESFGVARVEGVVDTPPNDEIGLGPRACAPIRHDDVLLGYVWVIPGAQPLDDEERRALGVAATEAAVPLWRRRLGRAETAALLGAVLDERDPRIREDAARALRDHLRWAADQRYAVALATVDAGAGPDPFTVATSAARKWPVPGVVWRGTDDQVTALAPLSGPLTAGDLAQALRRAGAARAGAASAVRLLDARAARQRAADALTVVTTIPDHGPAADADDLGAWISVVRTWDAAGRPTTAAPWLQPLLDHRDGSELLRALEAALDRAGDAAAAAADLHVHRATLYRRLDRVRELTGIDLRRGDDVLKAHLAVRTRRLADGTQHVRAGAGG